MSSLHLKKSESQHMLKNTGLIDTIIGKARIKPTDTCLDIGAGTGSITMKLLEKAKKVVAYEPDRALARELQSKVSRISGLKNKLELIEGDVLYYDFPHFDVCVSNIPFHISLPIVLKLMSCNFKSAFLLVQKEFAERMYARPGTPSYCRLSVAVQMYAQVENVIRVSRNSFTPPPKVDSCFIRIEPKTPRPQIEFAEFDNLLKICFGRKNKLLSSNLKSANLESKVEKIPALAGVEVSALVDSALAALKMEEARTSKMTIEDFLELFLYFKRVGLDFN
ncbi:18S rRNA (adenine1779-N6/adenine1780-N6)-dimethyltransferase [Enteropsectra breve]|nr:18S rRNA (adenine1779-N6/adenine1780-N6)-dimethyltransferase [Enteropsectra breve]